MDTAFQLKKISITKLPLLELQNPTLYNSNQARSTVCIGVIQSQNVVTSSVLPTLGQYAISTNLLINGKMSSKYLKIRFSSKRGDTLSTESH